MRTIAVERGLGDKRGPDVNSTLLADTVLVERGRHELNKNAYPIVSVQLETRLSAAIDLRDLVEVSDPSSNLPYNARVTGIEITIKGGDASQRLSLERLA